MTLQFDGYSDVVQIGEGGLGNVYRAVRKSTGGVVAIKELREVGVGSPVWRRARSRASSVTSVVMARIPVPCSAASDRKSVV